MPLARSTVQAPERPRRAKKLPVATAALPAAPRRRGDETRDRLIAVGAHLMAEHGYGGVSLRQICQDAGVNLALLHYHFGSKEKLLQEIFERGASPINQRRSDLLQTLEKKYKTKPAPIQEVLHAFVSPTLLATAATTEFDRAFLKLSGRLSTDPTPEVREVMTAVYDSVAHRFVKMLQRSCGHLSDKEFFMRLVFFYGAMLYTRADTGRVLTLASLQGVKLQPLSGPDYCEMIIPFLTAGFAARATRSRA